MLVLDEIANLVHIFHLSVAVHPAVSADPPPRYTVDAAGTLSHRGNRFHAGRRQEGLKAGVERTAGCSVLLYTIREERSVLITERVNVYDQHTRCLW